MTDEDSASTSSGEDEDTGEPVTQLRDLELGVDDAFVERVGRGIQRSLLAGDLVRLAWEGPFVAFKELIRAPLEWLAGGTRPSNSDQED